MLLLRWYLRMIAGSLFMGMICCQDNNPLSMENEPEATVILSVDTRSEPSAAAAAAETRPFACHHCIHCQDKSNFTIAICRYETDMCFTARKRINKTDQIIRRGCTTSKDNVPYPMMVK